MEKTTDKGTLKYRMPNILEVYDLLDLSGVNGGVTDTLRIKRNVIEHMKPLIDFTAIEGAKSYEDILNMTDEMILPLGEISDEVIGRILEVFRKKT